MTAVGPDNESTLTYTVAAGGWVQIFFPYAPPGLWTFTAELPGETLTASTFVDCGSDS
jgi:hypothetical protein